MVRPLWITLVILVEQKI